MKKLFISLFLGLFALSACGGGSGGSIPIAPSGLSAQLGNVSGELVLSWESVSGATTYNLYWGMSPGVTKDTGTKIENVTNPYAHTSLTNGSSYYYVVTAVNSSGESGISTEASAVPMLNPVGVLDTDFNSVGYVKYENASVVASYGNGMTQDAQGRILVLGDVFIDATGYDIAVWRYNSDGMPDTSFDGDGIVIINNAAGGNNWDKSSYGIAVDAAGKIVIAGFSRNVALKYEVVVIRLTSDGALDPSFGTGGIVRYDRGMGMENYANDMAIDSSGRIVVAGYAGGAEHDDLMLLRLTSSGELDSSFGTGGAVFLDAVPGYSGSVEAKSVVLDASGRIVLSGTVNSNVAGIFRYTDAGVLDTTFNDDGIVTYEGVAGARGDGIVLDDSGRILVSGCIYGSSYCNPSVFRYNENGSLDMTFGTNGITQHDAGFEGYGTDIVLDARNNILFTGGFSTDTFVYTMLLLRLDQNGVLDPSFGTGGVVTYHNLDIVDSWDMGNALAFDSIGRILVAGQTDPYVQWNMMIWRYE